MRDNVRAIVRIAAETLAVAGPVYEFGSFQVDDQIGLADLRPYFRGRQYVGCDMRPGVGVDRIEDLSRLTLDDDIAGTIICVETLEHVFAVQRAIDEMLRVLAPGGVIVITTPFDFRLHDYPSDYWRLTPACLSRLLAPLAAAMVGWQGLESDPHTVFAVACKTPAPAHFAAGVSRFMGQFQAWLAEQSANVSWPERLKQQTLGRLRSKGERRRMANLFTAGYTLRLPSAADWREACGLTSAAK